MKPRTQQQRPRYPLTIIEVALAVAWGLWAWTFTAAAAGCVLSIALGFMGALART